MAGSYFSNVQVHSSAFGNANKQDNVCTNGQYNSTQKKKERNQQDGKTREVARDRRVFKSKQLRYYGAKTSDKNSPLREHSNLKKRSNLKMSNDILRDTLITYFFSISN